MLEELSEGGLDVVIGIHCANRHLRESEVAEATDCSPEHGRMWNGVDTPSAHHYAALSICVFRRRF